jgi:hypothetical protein
MARVIRKDQFEWWSGESSLWAFNAGGLIVSAEALRREGARVLARDAARKEPHERTLISSFLNRTAVFLYALAIENLLKGLRVSEAKRRGDQHVKATSKGLQFKFASHDLLRLATESRIPLTDSDKKLLRVLTKVVLWSGRYHTPTRASEPVWAYAPGRVTITRVAAFARKVLVLSEN